MNWNPHDLFHCLDSVPLAWVTVVLCLGVLAGYVAIVKTTWLPSMRDASPEARKALKWMAALFLFCGVAGYGTVALAAVAPEVAYLARVIFLIALNIINPMFLLSKHGQEFRVLGRTQALGYRFEECSKQFEKMTDREIAVLSRALAAEFLERKVKNA